MAQEIQAKKPLWSGEFAWVGSKKDGSQRAVIGPDPLDSNEEDVWLAQDTDPTKVKIVDGPIQAIRPFITLQPGKFAILTNPTNPTDETHPNGSWAKGRREPPSLNLGTKRVIVAGHFPLWPGQAVETRDVYRLLPSNYLIVRVVSDKVDENAPYYGVTAKCASAVTAVVDDTRDTGSQQVSPTKGEDATAPAEAESAKSVTEQKPVFQVGQLIRISGTPTYIPPTGVEVVKDTSTGKEIRSAVELGPTEFCSLLDREGQVQRKPGPGRVFPGPYDVVQTEGSRNGVYDAYHLRDDRGLLIRVVADSIVDIELRKQLPVGVKFEGYLDGRVFRKGDEIFIQEISAYLVPGSAIEVIDPETRLPHVGNDHKTIFVQAIGVDQKSGIYVADVKTGNVDLVRGEKSEVLDPRFKKHVKRKVPGHAWNLMIGHGEPHKKARERDSEDFASGKETMVETPWALSITVPNNEAVLVTSRSGRRAVVGPKMELLGYDETLQVLGLSRGKCKSDDNLLETCFLRVDGNNVSDKITLQTSDYVTVTVDVSYGLRFVGDTDEDRVKWFAYTNYVQFFVDHLRSVLRAEARKLKLADLIGNVAEFVRDTVLGQKPDDGHRTGKKFGENNLLVYEVEVLNWEIPDRAVAEKISATNRSVVTRQLDDADRQNALGSKRAQDEADVAMKELDHDMLVRNRDLRLAQAEANDQVATKEHELAHALDMRKHQDGMKLQRQQADVADELKKRELARGKSQADQDNAITQAENATAEAHAEAEATVRDRSIENAAKADVERLKAVQPQLIEAIVGAANAQLAGEVARHLPPASGGILGPILGAGGVKALRQFVQGTPMEKALEALESNGSLGTTASR
jgi:hypothetical protein